MNRKKEHLNKKTVRHYCCGDRESVELHIFCNECSKSEFEVLKDICLDKLGMDVIDSVKYIRKYLVDKKLPFVYEGTQFLGAFVRTKN